MTYGGTELFVAHLACGLHARGHEVTVYANGESRVPCHLKWRYRRADWPPADPAAAQLKNVDHSAWAIRDAMGSADVLHLNDVVGAPFTQFIDLPAVMTLHHPHEPALSQQYSRYPDIRYVCISAQQARREPMKRTSVVHHGLELDTYTHRSQKQDYLVFLGRMAPCKGVQVAIEVALRTGLPLKLAGEVQPIFGEYWERQIAPHIDGRQIQYVGQADFAKKNALLANARALLFPIQWEEPFGLVMIEAMACGTPVLAFRGGAVSEIVRNGVSGWICGDVAEMADRALAPGVAAESCRAWVSEHFSLDCMVDKYLQIYDHVFERPRVEPLESRPAAHSHGATGIAEATPARGGRATESWKI